MQIIVKTTPEELKRAKKWWNELELQWKFAYNEAVFGKGTVLEPPKDDELMILLVKADALRFAGPLAVSPNMTVELTNLSGLIPLYQLYYLSISDTKITSLQELRRHTKIEYLFVYNNKLTSLEGIEGMKGLKELYAQHNQLTDLSPVKNLTQLETLYVSNNKLTKINGISKKHKHMKRFHVLPNNNLPDREVINFQNKEGILCKVG